MSVGDFFGNILKKDVENVSNQGSNLWNNTVKTAGDQYDRVTGQKIKTKKGKESKHNGTGRGRNNRSVPTNRAIGEITEETIEPIEASFDSFYKSPVKSESYKIDSIKGQKETVEGEEGYWSMFNAWSVIKWRGTMLDGAPNEGAYNAPSYMSTSSEQEISKRNPSASRIVEYCKDKKISSYQYEYADFALCKYYGKIPNEYMLTLRRFPMPVEDDIVNIKAVDAKGQPYDKITPDLARAITWMSESTGNKLDDILKFTVSTTWEAVDSKIQEIDSSAGNRGGRVGSEIRNSSILSGIYGAANGMNAVQTYNAKENASYDPVTGTYPNHVFGPINVIKQVTVRQPGLNFAQDMSLKFSYDLRQLKGVNPRVAFLDLMANLLVLTYNNGNFWGGSVRYTGQAGKFNKPFGDISKIKSGDFGGFLSGLLGSALKGIGNVVSDISQNGLMGSKLGNNLIGGKLMEMFNTPQGADAVNAFLTGDATGQYHLTVGNPLNPIAVIGNLYCDSADFQFGGELSYDGFPTELTLTVSLKHARPRDKGDIESMFNGGRGRLYLTPEGGVDTNQNVNVSAYGNKDMKNQSNDILKKMANG